MTEFTRNDRPKIFKRHDKVDTKHYSLQPPKRRRGGRPTEYNPALHPKISKQLLKTQGFTNEQLADALCISINTLYQWIDDREELAQAIKEGRDLYDGTKVENTLLRRALGYEYEEVKTKEILVSGVDAEGVAVALPAREVTRMKKFVKPNITAIIFWLKNRQPGRWRDIQAIDLKSHHTEEKVHRFEMLAGLKIEFDKLETGELEQLLGNIRRDDAITVTSGSDVR